MTRMVHLKLFRVVKMKVLTRRVRPNAEYIPDILNKCTGDDGEHRAADAGSDGRESQRDPDPVPEPVRGCR